MKEIVLIFYYEDEEELKMIVPETTTVKEALINFLNDKNLANDLSLEKISFLWGSRILNRPQNLDKSLIQIFKTNNGNFKKIIVKDTSYIIGSDPVDFLI